MNIRDDEKFGEFLNRARMQQKEERSAYARKLHLNKNAVACWETGVSFPKEDRLEEIALCYKVNLSTLKDLFFLSKKSREDTNKSRAISRRLLQPKKVFYEVFPGEIQSNNSELVRLNFDLNIGSKGRP